jgi:hypothetical protein
VSDQLNTDEIIALIKDQFAEMEERLLNEIRKSQKASRKPEFQSPFLRRKQAIELLGTRSVLEACERLDGSKLPHGNHVWFSTGEWTWRRQCTESAEGNTHNDY